MILWLSTREIIDKIFRQNEINSHGVEKNTFYFNCVRVTCLFECAKLVNSLFYIRRQVVNRSFAIHMRMLIQLHLLQQPWAV